MNNEFYEEFSKLSDKDRKEVLDLMQYKIHIDNTNFKNRVEHLENIIEGLESDVRVLGEHIEDDCTAHEEALKWCVEAHELAIENKELQERINKAIEFIHGTEYQYGDLEQDSYDYNMCFNEVEDLLKILKGED